MSELRCPYCRGSVRAGADQDRVACATCEAELHAECVVEAGGCASCRGTNFLVGEAPVELPALVQLAKDPDKLARLARPKRWRAVARLLLNVARLLAVAAGAWVGHASNSLATGLLVAIVGLLVVTGVSVFVFPPRRLRRVGAHEWGAVVGVIPADPGRVLEEQLRSAGIPDPEFPPGPHPERCPACGTSLEAWFCHECGASAVPGDGKEKGDDAKEKDEPPRERA